MTYLSSHRGLLPTAAALVLYFGLVVSLQRYLGAPQAEFGGIEFPDDASHYIAGLMFHDYLTHGLPQPPMSYATHYYTYIPYFAVGYWPPFFYVVESLWMICFGISRGHVLLLTALVSALLAAVLFATVRKTIGDIAAFGIGLLFLLAPVVQQSSMAIMTDLPVALGSLLAILFLARYVDTERTQDAILFGVLASLTILTKSSGFALGALPPLAVLLTRRLYLFKRWSFWLMGIVVLVLCGPWFLMTRHLLTLGFGGTVKSISACFEDFLVVFWHNLGFLLILSLLGAWRLLIQRPLSGLTAVCVAHPIVALLFFSIAPTPSEPRYLTTAFPPLLILAATGFQWIVGKIEPRFSRPRVLAPLLMLLLVVSAGRAWLFQFPPVVPSPVEAFAEFIVSHPYQAVLVNPDMEGPTLAGIAMLQHHRAQDQFLIRPNKLLVHTNWISTRYETIYKSPQEIEAVLEQTPVDLVILRKDLPKNARPHEVLLHQAVFQVFADRWRKVYSSSTNGVEYDLFEPLIKPAISTAAMEKSLGRILGSHFSNPQ